MTKKTKVIIIITSIITALFLILSFIISSSVNKEEKVSLQANSVRLLSSFSPEIPDDIEITPDEMDEYQVGVSFVFTKNIDKEKAIEALKHYMVFYNGEPVHTDTKITVTLKNLGNTTNGISINCEYPNGTKRSYYSGYSLVDAPDGIEYAAVTPFGANRYAIVVAKNSVTRESNINQLPLHAFKARYNYFTAPTFNFDYNECLQAECETWLKSYIQHGNGDYKYFYANLRILDNLTVDTYEGNGNTDEYVAPNDNVIPTEPNMPNESTTTPSENITDAINKIKENDAAKITTGIISCVLGAGVIYLVFILLRKLFKCLRK